MFYSQIVIRSSFSVELDAVKKKLRHEIFFLERRFWKTFSDNPSLENAFFVKTNPLDAFKSNKFLSDSMIYTEILSDRYKPT